MNSNQFLTKKLHQGPVFIYAMVNSTVVVVHSKTNFVKAVQNQLLYRKPLQDRHVTYCGIKTTLGISGTSIHSILHEHLTVKKICSHLDPTQFVIRSKALAKGVDWSKEIDCSKNMIAVLRNTSMTSWQVVNRGFTRMSPKVNNSRLYECFKMSQIQEKLFTHEELPSKWSPAFSEKLDMSQSFR